jgi:hypothetical protein
LHNKVVIDVNFTEWGSIANFAKEFVDIVREPSPHQRAEFVYMLMGFFTDIEKYLDMPGFVAMVIDTLTPKDEEVKP